MLTNAYCSLNDVKGATMPSTVGTQHDNEVELAINASSRAIDGYTGWPHGFWKDDTVKVRTYRPESHACCLIPEGIATTSGLIVKIDDGADGTYETTLTVSTDFILEPLNAAANTPAWPYDEITIVDNYWFPATARPSVQVTAVFGWPAVPDDVKQACILLANDLWKAKDAPFGVAGIAEMGVLRITQNRTVQMLLAPYRKASVG